jgi:hypothetical protein
MAMNGARGPAFPWPVGDRRGHEHVVAGERASRLSRPRAAAGWSQGRAVASCFAALLQQARATVWHGAHHDRRH